MKITFSFTISIATLWAVVFGSVRGIVREPTYTDFVPGAWMKHDQLHVRGGHRPILGRSHRRSGRRVFASPFRYVRNKQGGYRCASFATF